MFISKVLTQNFFWTAASPQANQQLRLFSDKVIFKEHTVTNI